MLSYKPVKIGRSHGYKVTAVVGDKVRSIIVGHSRADEEAHIRFVDEHRDETNKKPYRTKALKEEARRTAVKRGDGSWFSPTGWHTHATEKKGNQTY